MEYLAFVRKPRQTSPSTVSGFLSNGARVKSILIAAILVVAFATTSIAQGPGALPPKDAIRATANGGFEDANGIPVKAFLFLDESGFLVVARGLSYQRYLELESGGKSQSQFFEFAPMQINARVSGSRAELDLKFKVTVDATNGRLEPISLKLSNFHLLRAAEFTSNPPSADANDMERLTIAPNGGGYVLWVRSAKRRTITVKMTMSAKVNDGAKQALEFRLPDVATVTNLRTDIANAKAETHNQEVIRSTKKTNDGGTAFDIESNGGKFTVYWAQKEKGVETTPRLEVDGTIKLNLSEESNQLIQKVGLDVRNSRGSVSSFEVELPPGSKVIENTAVLAANKQPLIISKPSKANRVTITIPVFERMQRVACTFDLQLPRSKLSRENPLIMSVPKVINALKHQGEIQIQTGSESRLQWLTTNWVRKLLGDGSDETNSQRFYQFKYERSDFGLPLWLSASRRQLRLACDTQIKIMSSSARLEKEIRFTGQSNESLTLQLDMADWQLLDVLDAETDEPLLREQTNNIVSVDMNLETDAPPPIRIIAERQLSKTTTLERAVGFIFDPTNAQWPIQGDDDDIVFSIPRVLNTGNNMIVRSSTVALQSTGRNAFEVHTQDLDGVERAPSNRVDASASAMVNRFRLSPGKSVKIIGSLVPQPPQITLASSADVQLTGDRLKTSLTWTVDPRFDLGGSLPVRVSGLVNDQTSQDGMSQDFLNPGEGWVVRVNDSVAKLKSLGNDRYELISSSLTNESVTIRWNQERTIDRSVLDTEIQEIDLPSPALADVTVRGDIIVKLTGDVTTDLYAVDSSAADQLLFQSLPEQIRVRLARRSTEKDEQTVRKAILRTAFGSRLRHEQLLAVVQGGNAFVVPVPGGTDDLDVEVFVDRATSRVSRTKDSLIIALPTGSESHLVDLRIWVAEGSQGMVGEIKPTLVLPMNAGRIYWQLNSPRDSHLVWAAPAVERAMEWKFGRWQLSREPIRNDTKLAQWVGAQKITAMPPGNQYLYVGSDARSFHARAMTRPWLWFIVGGFVLGVAWMLTHIPTTRSPFTAIAAAVLYTGLLAIAPDAAVLAGQWAMVGLVLIVVMFAVKALLAPQSRARVLRPIAAPAGPDPSTRLTASPEARDDSNLPVTHSLDAGASPSEVSS